MINYVSIDIPKRSLKKVGRKIVLRLFEENNILCKYQILGKYLCLNSTDLISKNIKDKYGLMESELCESNIEQIYKKIKYLIKEEKKIQTFAIKVERKGEHKFTSTELAKELAGSVFDLFPKIKVNLGNPDLKVNVKILNNKCLIYTEKK
tara:strand:- start:327 stop:776 length:450 start_codon:yes stop_codon:yes gene_type:complete